MSNPRISIISICRNEGEGLTPTIRSVLAQTFTDFEYIIKDGGSTDDTLKRAEGYEEAFRKRGIAYQIISREDKGIYDAMNEGVSLSSGEWINFLNAGDSFYNEDTLKEIFEGKTWDGVELLYGDTLEEEFGEYHFFRKCPELIEERMPFSHQSVFVRRRLMEEYPFDLKYPITADYNFLLELHQRGCVFKDTGEIVSVVEKGGVSSVKLKDTYLETAALRRDRGISRLSDEELKKKLWIINLKQFGMDHFPRILKYSIRKVQKKLRHQQRVDYRSKWR